MSRIPPEIARFREPGTQIKCIRGHYYLAKVTSRWDPVAKKVRKVYLGHLGTVTEEGVVPRRSVRRPADARTYSKEFGATWAVSELTGDIHEALRKHFHGDADWLYVTALLRCVRHCAMRYTEHFYGVSYLSERFPGLNLSIRSPVRANSRHEAAPHQNRDKLAFHSINGLKIANKREQTKTCFQYAEQERFIKRPTSYQPRATPWVNVGCRYRPGKGKSIIPSIDLSANAPLHPDATHPISPVGTIFFILHLWHKFLQCGICKGMPYFQ